MAEHKGKYRTIYLVTAALMVAMIGGYALAATTVTTLNPQQSSNVTNTPAPGGFANIGSIGSEQLVILSAGMTALVTAGTQTGGTVGLSGTPTALAVCAVAPCAAQNFRDASQGAQTTGNYGEQVVVNVIQPATGGTSLGFDFSVTVVASTGTVVAQGYLATGVSTAVGTETIPVFVFVDLGSTTAPVINSLTVVFNQCSSATACP
ncbi:MAG: hypothetical protein ABSA63_01935 [Thermoplasmata archaeon]|jgi:hypothetical protein